MEGERQTESGAHFDEYYTERRSAFTRAVITATHSVHLTSPLRVLSSLSVIHGALAQSEWFAPVIEITGFLRENRNGGTPVMTKEHPCDVTDDRRPCG